MGFSSLRALCASAVQPVPLCRPLLKSLHHHQPALHHRDGRSRGPWQDGADPRAHGRRDGPPPRREGARDVDRPGLRRLDAAERPRRSIIDVPGHERFLKNMLAGAGGIDLVLLVIAADEGVMPQTREHLDILNILPVPHGVVAVTKATWSTRSGWS